MTHRLVHTAALLALAAISTCAPAQTVLQTDSLAQAQAGDGVMETEPPGRVGRVSLVQGKVEIGGAIGSESNAALVNWPVTTSNLVTTAPGARTEIRIGSTSIRLDGDSSLEFTELDDDSLRLRLHFGSASIRVMNSEVVPEFELRTAQATVRLTQPGRLRVDADHQPDTSLVSVLDGEAQVDGAGASLTVRAGRSAEVRDDDVRTLQAQRDEFDDWSLTRDQTLVAEQSQRHIGTEMTGYEELDRYGSWSTHTDYGSLWTPTTVAADWTPYRDGQWSYIAPWGWTWVDNAPWGYAPFHYGRWVQVRNRWAWAPGRLERRPVWSPALVGWVGGGSWSVGFGAHNLHAHGWYPLSPYDRYVPGYRLSDERLRRLNDWRHATRRAAQQRPHHGLTVVPREHFGGRGPVVVPRAPRPDRASLAVPRGPGSAPPPPLVTRAGFNGDRRELLDRREVRQRLEAGRVTQDRFEQRDPMAGQRESNERLARERAQHQERVARQQDERDRMQRDLDNRLQADRLGFQRDRAEREQREQRDRMRERAERMQQQQQRPIMTTNPAPAFARPEPRPMPRPEPRPDPRPIARPEPRPAAPPQMVAPPPPRPQPSAPAFQPRGGGEQRAHTDARGRQIMER